MPAFISMAERSLLRIALAWALLGLSASGEEPARLRVGAWITSWDQKRGLARLEAAPDVIRDVFFFAGALTDDGGLVLQPESSSLSDAIRKARHGGRRTWLTIVNDVHPMRGGSPRLKDGAVVQRILSDPQRRKRHRNEIVETADRLGVSGIDIDYENLDFGVRSSFTTFVEELATDLTAHGRFLSVTVQPKAGASRSRGPGAADWQRLCGSVSRLQIMLYNLHSGQTGPGPIATPEWIQEVLEYAGTQCPPERIVPVLKVIGMDWGDDTTRSAQYDEVTSRARERDVSVERDVESDVPFIRFYSPEGDHTVYFEDTQSLGRKLDVIRRLGLTSVVFWRLGGEDPTLLPYLSGR